MKSECEKVFINTPFIKLDSFLKFAGAASTGGEAKMLISGGRVLVDNEVCRMRGKKLVPGNIVAVPGAGYEVASA